MDYLCILCDKILLPKDSRTVGKRAINTFIQASKRRKDKKYLKLIKWNSIDIHINCHSNYIRGKGVKTVSKETPKSTSQTKSVISQTKSTSQCQQSTASIDTDNFDFAQCCFFCGKPALKSSKKIRVKMVKSDTTRTNILEHIKDRYNDEEFLKNIYNRLHAVNDLSTLNARYHGVCMNTFYNSRPNNSHKIGRPSTEYCTSAIQHIIDYINMNENGCQFSLKRILETYTGELPVLTHIKRKLHEIFNDSITFQTVKDDVIICFVDSEGNTLHNIWDEDRTEDQEDERKRIVDTAARIILQDIQTRYCDTNENESSRNTFSDIPPTLKLFLDVLLKSNSKSKSKTGKRKLSDRVATYAHCIMSSIRPRSFASSILLGISSMMRKNSATKKLINSLSYLGLCSSYNNILNFESATYDPQQYDMLMPEIQIDTESVHDDVDSTFTEQTESQDEPQDKQCDSNSDSTAEIEHELDKFPVCKKRKIDCQ